MKKLLLTLLLVFVATSAHAIETFKDRGFHHYRDGDQLCLGYNDREPICFPAKYEECGVISKLILGFKYSGESHGKGYNGRIDSRNPIFPDHPLTRYRGYYLHVKEQSPSLYIIRFVEGEDTAEIYVHYEYVSEPLAIFE